MGRESWTANHLMSQGRPKFDGSSGILPSKNVSLGNTEYSILRDPCVSIFVAYMIPLYYQFFTTIYRHCIIPNFPAYIHW